MPYAHKLSIYTDEPYKPVVYCTVCGHDDNLSGPCQGAAISQALENGFKEIFGSKTEYGSKYLKEVLDSQKASF